jgi:anaerobic magnesium-protoporphyrin IX monomethyl ester cyclase
VRVQYTIYRQVSQRLFTGTINWNRYLPKKGNCNTIELDHSETDRTGWRAAIDRVVLLYPKVYYRQQYHPWTWAPLALLTVAAPLVRKGYDVRLVDMNLGAGAEEVVEACRGAVCVGISAMTGPQIHFGLQAARAIRDRYPDLPLVWGGYHPSLLPEQTAQSELVDVVVRGQGEVTFAEVIERLSASESLAGVAGITYRDGPAGSDAAILANPPRAYANVNDFPPLPYHRLAEVERYINPMEVSDRTLNYVSSQGCPHRCEFCAEPQVYGRHWTGLAPERVADDVERMVKDYRVDGVMFFDSNFFVDEKRARGVCEELIRRKLKVRWAANARADNVLEMDPSTFDLLNRAGFYSFLVGGETGSPDQLKEINKDISAEDIIRCSQVCARHGVRISYSFIFGFPGETEMQAEQSWRVIKRVSAIGGEYNSQVHLFAPSPSTGLYGKSVDHGLPVPQSLAEWARYSTLEESDKPWLDRQHVRLVQQRTFYLLHGYPSRWLRKRTQRSGPKVRLYRHLAHAFAHARCRLDFYRFPVDWWLLQKLKGLSREE